MTETQRKRTTGAGKRRTFIDKSVFTLALQRLGDRAMGANMYRAARLVLCEGRRISEAAKLAGSHRQSVHEAIANIEKAYRRLGICPYCGSRLKDV